MENQGLIDELTTAREGLFEVLGAVAPESMTTPGLLGEWSARELIAHLGYWAGNATETIHRFEMGIAEGDDSRSVDEINETVARVARQTGMATVLKREQASFDALVERLEALDTSQLDAALLEAIRADGSAHYREHAVELRRILGERPHG